MLELLLLLVPFGLGMLTPYIFRGLFHSHDWEILFNRTMEVLPGSFGYERSFSEQCAGFKINRSSVRVIYKRCRKCGETSLKMTDGSSREFKYDSAFFEDTIKELLVKEKEDKDRALLGAMDKWIEFKDRENPPQKNTVDTPQITA
jgi:hypothetical protein